MSARPTTRSPKNASGASRPRVKREPSPTNARGEPIDRPFDPDLLAQAAAAAEGYRIVLYRADGLWFGTTEELPGAMNHGATPNAAVKATREILTTVIAYLMEEGEPVPPPATDDREEHVEVNVSAAELRQLERFADRAGFRGVGDYLRHLALNPR